MLGIVCWMLELWKGGWAGGGLKGATLSILGFAPATNEALPVLSLFLSFRSHFPGPSSITYFHHGLFERLLPSITALLLRTLTFNTRSSASSFLIYSCPLRQCHRCRMKATPSPAQTHYLCRLPLFLRQEPPSQPGLPHSHSGPSFLKNHCLKMTPDPIQSVHSRSFWNTPSFTCLFLTPLCSAINSPCSRDDTLVVKPPQRVSQQSGSGAMCTYPCTPLSSSQEPLAVNHDSLQICLNRFLKAQLHGSL